MNGSLNDATYDNGGQIAQSPRRTGAAGVIYNDDGVARAGDHLFASVMTKYVGPQYGQYKLTNGVGVDSYPIKSVDDTSASVSYRFLVAPGKALAFAVDIDNLFNRTGLIGLAAVAGDGVTPLYWTQPGRSVFFSLSGRFG